MQLVIRRATIDDASSMSDLLAELGYSVPPDQVCHHLANEPDSVVLVAVTGTTIVGLAGVSTRHQLHKGALVSTIDELVVTHEMRVRGVGRALVDAATYVARDRGATRLDLHSRSDRVDAYRFYQRMGFDIVVAANYLAQRLDT
jgi:(aminoalkyl)phosphonate N-acetyltransferase